MKLENKVEFHVPDKYYKTVIFNPSDDFFIGMLSDIL